MKPLKTLSTTLMLLTMLIGIHTKTSAQSSGYGGEKYIYGGTAYVYAEDSQGKDMVLNASTNSLFSSEADAKNYLAKELTKWRQYKNTSDIRYSIERWNSRDKSYEGYASATVVDSRGNKKNISVTIDCDAVGLGHVAYFKNALQQRLDREKSNSYEYASPISYRVSTCY